MPSPFILEFSLGFHLPDEDLCWFLWTVKWVRYRTYDAVLCAFDPDESFVNVTSRISIQRFNAKVEMLQIHVQFKLRNVFIGRGWINPRFGQGIIHLRLMEEGLFASNQGVCCYFICISFWIVMNMVRNWIFSHEQCEWLIKSCTPIFWNGILQIYCSNKMVSPSLSPLWLKWWMIRKSWLSTQSALLSPMESLQARQSKCSFQPAMRLQLPYRRSLEVHHSLRWVAQPVLTPHQMSLNAHEHVDTQVNMGGQG